jgi:hypothetical protein
VKMWTAFLAFHVLACSVGAVEMEKSKLRQLAEMPTVRIKSEFDLSSKYGFSIKERFQTVLQGDDKNKTARKGLFDLGPRIGPTQECDAVDIRNFRA